MMLGLYVAKRIADEADAITREKDGQALTEPEVSTLKADAFMRAVAPYLYESTPGPGTVKKLA